MSDATLPPRFYEIAEREHGIQNPTSAEKIRLLGSYVRLGADDRVLDVAAGRCGPALILAGEFGCRIDAVELREEFVEAARDRIGAASLESQIELTHADARTLEFPQGAYDVAMCLGASFVWGGLDGTLRALAPAARTGGHVVVGEPYLRTPVADEEYGTLAETVERIAHAGLALVGLIASSEDDWDRYESLHWRSFEEWLAESPDDEIRRRHEEFRDDYLRRQRDALGWAIFVARKA